MNSWTPAAVAAAALLACGAAAAQFKSPEEHFEGVPKEDVAIRLSSHPRATRQIEQARGWGILGRRPNSGQRQSFLYW